MENLAHSSQEFEQFAVKGEGAAYYSLGNSSLFTKQGGDSQEIFQQLQFSHVSGPFSPDYGNELTSVTVIDEHCNIGVTDQCTPGAGDDNADGNGVEDQVSIKLDIQADESKLNFVPEIDSSKVTSTGLIDISKVNHLLQGEPTLIHIRSKGVLNLCCMKKNGCILRTQYFKCSEEGLRDVSAVTSVQEFINSEMFETWLDSSGPFSSLSLYDNSVKEEVIGTSQEECMSSCDTAYEQIASPLKSVSGRQAGNRGRRRKYRINRTRLDTSNIASLVYGKPSLVYMKAKKSVRLLCVLKNGGKSKFKHFRCSRAGLSDKEAVAKVQKFIDSSECITWLTSDNETLNTQSTGELYLVGKPLISVCKPGILAVVCRLSDGRQKSKKFRCSSEGKNDKNAMSEIYAFLASPMFDEWLLGDASKWNFEGEVTAGVETSKYIAETIKFDFCKEFKFEKQYVTPVYDEGTCTLSIIDRGDYRSHRLDERYIPTEQFSSSLDRPVASINIICSSKTSECRTDCGILLSEVTVNDKIASCCQFDVKQNVFCHHCRSDSSSRWYKSENRMLCFICYTYRLRKGIDRPHTLLKKGDRIYHKHLQCKWRLKLLLYSGDLTKWRIYFSRKNSFYHSNNPVQIRRRPDLAKRDNWDVACSQKKVTPLSVTGSALHFEPFHVKNSADQYERKQIRNRKYVIEKHLNALSTKSLDWELLEKILASYDSRSNGCEDDFDILQMKRNKKSSKVSVGSILCAKCIDESKEPIFRCGNSQELEAHLVRSHRENNLACCVCYANGIISRFRNEKELRDHQATHIESAEVEGTNDIIHIHNLDSVEVNEAVIHIPNA